MVLSVWWVGAVRLDSLGPLACHFDLALAGYVACLVRLSVLFPDC